MIQAHVTFVFYRKAYRSAAGLEILEHSGVVPVHYVRWRDAWR
jgi:hypothetical protein